MPTLLVLWIPFHMLSSLNLQGHLPSSRPHIIFRENACIAPFTKTPLSPANIWILLSVWKCTISILCRVSWLCSSHRCVSSDTTVLWMNQVLPAAQLPLAPGWPAPIMQPQCPYDPNQTYLDYSNFLPLLDNLNMLCALHIALVYDGHWPHSLLGFTVFFFVWGVCVPVRPVSHSILSC